MIDDWLGVLGCPMCQRSLALLADGALWCSTCHQAFPVRDGIPVLVRPEDAARLEALSRDWSQARRREGWLPVREDDALALPYGRPPGYPALYWRVRRQSYEVLRRVLHEEGPTPEQGPVADLGAGAGWLAHRLAEAEYRVCAVDANRDAAFGLGAAAVYLGRGPGFLRVLGDLEHPPFQPGCLALIVCNASLHYADGLEYALRRAAKALSEGGRLLVVDTPIARQSRPGTGRGDRHLGREELAVALQQAGLDEVRWWEVRRGARWWVHQAGAWLRRAPRFSFPLVTARRAG